MITYKKGIKLLSKNINNVSIILIFINIMLYDKLQNIICDSQISYHDNGNLLWIIPTQKDENCGNTLFWDILSFRPNIKENIEEGEVYNGKTKFKYENLIDGKRIYYPYELHIGEHKFVNVVF